MKPLADGSYAGIAPHGSVDLKWMVVHFDAAGRWQGSIICKSYREALNEKKRLRRRIAKKEKLK